MDAHLQDPPERSHPLLWTAGLLVIIAILIGWFTRWYATGAAHGRHEGLIELAKKAEPPVDHLKLIEDRSEGVIDRGAILFAKNCASCHGAQGNANPTNLNPPPRNFHVDAFKNPKGAGVYGIYTVLTEGFAGGRMPGFSASMPPADRYAVAHFLRERLVKPNNPANYLDKDSDETLASVPKMTDAVAGPVIHPKSRPIPPEVWALMRAESDNAGRAVANADAWLDRVLAANIGRAVAADLRRLRGSGTLIRLHQAASAKDDEGFRALTLDANGTGFLPSLATLPESALKNVFAKLSTAAAGTAGVH
ncbi:MAG: cytochrome c [Planctomycetes bacterium]|nr:cytochrome c [Planctomycetota bacterium]